MELDDEIAPLVQEMENSMSQLEKEFLPLLSQLDEDVVVSRYDIDAQARLYLSTAFTLAMSLFSLDKLNNEAHLHHPRVEAKDNLLMACGGSACDARLMLQLERITDAIKKLKEISSLKTQAAAAAAGATSSSATEGAMNATTTTTLQPSTSSSGVNQHLSASGLNTTTMSSGTTKSSTESRRKRGRSEESNADNSTDQTNTNNSNQVAEDADQLGDAALFSMVARPELGVGKRIGKIITRTH